MTCISTARRETTEDRVIALMLVGKTRAEIIREAHISKATFDALNGSPVFKARVRCRRDELTQAVLARLQANLLKNCDTLQSIIDDPQTPPQVRVNAISAGLSALTKLKKTEDQDTDWLLL